MMKKLHILFLAVMVSWATQSFAQKPGDVKLFEIYGLVMTDAGYNFNQIHPDYFDVVRPSMLPAFKNQYGTDGNVFFGIRQSTLGFKGYYPTSLGELKTIFEFDLFGLGKNAGTTAFHFRKAWAELGHFGVGQYWSLFCDFDIFPDCLDYWGPVGMALLPNIQIRWMPIMGNTHLYIALEKPGTSVDQGVFTERIELKGIYPHFPFPDLTAEYRYAGKLGYVELAGLLDYVEWKDMNNDKYELSGHALGYGINLTSKLNFTKNLTGKFGVVYGAGMENYMNDGPIDIGLKKNFSDTITPVLGVPLPVLGVSAFLDKQWNEKFSSSFGYSFSRITNSDAQDSLAYKRGGYALANLLYYPTAETMLGVELQYASRENYLDGWNTNMVKVQFSFRYKFSQITYRSNKADK